MIRISVTFLLIDLDRMSTLLEDYTVIPFPFDIVAISVWILQTSDRHSVKLGDTRARYTQRNKFPFFAHKCLSQQKAGINPRVTCRNRDDFAGTAYRITYARNVNNRKSSSDSSNRTGHGLDDCTTG